MFNLLPRRLTRHHVLIVLLPMLDYLQNVMLMFGAGAILAGSGGTLADFGQLVAACAVVSCVMIAAHRWCVQRLGYRRFLQWSLGMLFLGAVCCALADGFDGLLAGRLLQVLGASALFTAARVQIQHYQGPARGQAILLLPLGIMLGAGSAPLLAAFCLQWLGWRALFCLPVPLILLALWFTRVMPAHEPAVDSEPSSGAAAGLLWLLPGVALWLFALEQVRQVPLAAGGLSWGLGMLGCVLLLGHVYQQSRRQRGLLPYARFVSAHYLWGMAAYGCGYVLAAGMAYLLPLYLLHGLQLSVLATGVLLGGSTLLAIPCVMLHFVLMRRWPYAARYVLLAMLALASACGLLAGAGSQNIVVLLLACTLCHAVFMPFLLGTAAATTFARVEEQVFSQAYQAKNMLRELAGALGVSWAGLCLQALAGLPNEHLPIMPQVLQQVMPLVFTGVAVAALLCGGLLAWQRHRLDTKIRANA